ncbi:proprotein convertase P-domain-containing protein [Luteolibacter luteus]|uniref:P/Homo B domain-containing protein n=1 Tax=Luteolibacter luteus TaxID=2728835 RepID=A0A858RFW3_9BACT|nr:proprotein convertase P-domain-containing protein [Luteolibacter luteus]QJE95737.1 hypothetical protein HHL09_08040 [Luteolibacter luteus]
MKFATPACLLLGLPLCALAQEPPKTNSSQKVDSGLLSTEPYRHTGIVFAGDDANAFRGSGVVASDPKLFFTASHVLWDDEKQKWFLPPEWVGGYSADATPGLGKFSRGYFRWAGYSSVVTESGTETRGAFSRDISLAWGLEDFVEGEPAQIDFKGVNSLRKAKTSMITGYPALLDYTGESGGYFLHATEPDLTPFKSAVTANGNYLYATHISTGPGNSGGPVWSQDDGGQWKVSGLLVSGRPSEAGVYAMSSSVKSLLRAASPVIADPRKSNKSVQLVSTDTCRMVMNKPKRIPDGLHRWTKIPLKCIRFPEGSVVATAYLDLNITTNHRGDLIVAVLGPDGTMAIVHDGQGAGEDNLEFDDLPLSALFQDASAVGNWALLVQDRLTADPAVVTKLELEITAQPKTGGGSTDP